MNTHTARVLVSFADDPDRFLPEGPRSLVFDGREALAWVNIQTASEAKSGSIHLRFWDNGEQECWQLSGRPGFLFPTNKDGVLLVGMDKQIGTFDLETSDWSPLATIPDANPRTMLNDAEIVPGGRAIVCGTKDFLFKEPIAQLYLFTLDDNRISVLVGHQTCSNGKVFARDDRGLILYDIDTPTRKIVRYRFDLAQRTANLEGTGPDLASYTGFPDGMRDGGNGTVIVAFYNPESADAGKAIRFDLTTGRPVEEWLLPGSPRVTCPELVQSPDGIKIVLTTATEGMPSELRYRCPNAGFLFIADTYLSERPHSERLRVTG